MERSCRSAREAWWSCRRAGERTPSRKSRWSARALAWPPAPLRWREESANDSPVDAGGGSMMALPWRARRLHWGRRGFHHRLRKEGAAMTSPRTTGVWISANSATMLRCRTRTSTEIARRLVRVAIVTGGGSGTASAPPRTGACTPPGTRSTSADGTERRSLRRVGRATWDGSASRSPVSTSTPRRRPSPSDRRGSRPPSARPSSRRRAPARRAPPATSVRIRCGCTASTSIRRRVASTSPSPRTARRPTVSRGARSGSAEVTTVARPGRSRACPRPAMSGAAASRASGRTSSLGYVLVTFHTLDDARSAARVGSAITFSTDGGATWRAPAAVSGERWRASNLGGVVNGTGLRERAERLADGDVSWAYGDGRYTTGSRPGRVAIVGALIRLDPAHDRHRPPKRSAPAR
jgi:hypothetical protein